MHSNNSFSVFELLQVLAVPILHQAMEGMDMTCMEAEDTPSPNQEGKNTKTLENKRPGYN